MTGNEREDVRAQEAQDHSERAEGTRDAEEIIRLVAEGNRVKPPEPTTRWGKTKKLVREYSVVIFVIILLGSYGYVDNKLDADRQEAIRQDISGEREIIDQSERNLVGILCLTDRVDFLLDVELEGRELEDLSPEELEFVQVSCRATEQDPNGAGDAGEG